MTSGAPGENMKESKDDKVDQSTTSSEGQNDQRRKETEALQMIASPSGKAWRFVERIHEIQYNMQNSTEAERLLTDYNLKVQPVATDDMVWMAERIFALQEDFRSEGLPTNVDIGYHYTCSENMQYIRKDGLLTKSDRESRGLYTKHNGSVMGDGVYTACHPNAFHGRYGDVGLLVARLKGEVRSYRQECQTGREENTLISSTNPYKRATVLRSSSQCLALFSFPSDTNCYMIGIDLIYRYHRMLQLLVDEFFNEGVQTETDHISYERRPCTRATTRREVPETPHP